ncbi:uncharacterized protein [Clytia hemisphaerica]|uniref:uncharacterized protein n=1 Tax=Clytia hemisphaerica TaxID=252671 RepID=UPI0034D3C02D
MKCAMSSLRIQDYIVERNYFFETISESLSVIKSFYNKDDDEKHLHLHRICYTWEYQRIVPIINEFENVYTKYQDVLKLMLSKDQYEFELSFVKKFIRHSLDIINKPPDHIMLVLVPIIHTAEPLEIQRAEKVLPVRYEVVSEVVEKVTRVSGRKSVRDIEVCECHVAESVVPLVQEAVVVKNPMVVKLNCIKAVIEIQEENFSCDVKCESDVVFNEAYSKDQFQIGDKYCDLSKNLGNNSIAEKERCLESFEESMFLRKFYCKIFLRLFWCYFLFSDFLLFCFETSVCLLICSMKRLMCLLFDLVKNLFLTVGSVTAVGAVFFFVFVNSL